MNPRLVLALLMAAAALTVVLQRGPIKRYIDMERI
jgi:hypothetical protein